jgi:hypothetical protein
MIHVFPIDPTANLDQVLQRQDEREQAARLTIGNEYLEMVERIAEATPPNLQEMVARQLTQLNCMAVPALADAAAISLQGDQYRAYTTVTQSIQASRHQACDFFVTGPGGTGKSFLLKSLQHWCDTSRNSSLLLASTGTVALQPEILTGTRYNQPFGNMHVVVFGDLPEMGSKNNSLVCCKHENCTTSSCIYDIAWGPHDCNYISWNAAVCTYPHFVSDDSAETSHMSCNWNAVICTYPHSLKEGAPRYVLPLIYV